jgi:Putative transmembrane protein (PGPGW)
MPGARWRRAGPAENEFNLMAAVHDLIREHQLSLEWLALTAAVLLLLGLAVLPAVVIQLPEDYFVRDRRVPVRHVRRHPLLWWLVSVLKNILGLVLVVAGIAMLLLPGQGLLTILMGLGLLNFPGKFALERWIFGRPAVASTLNRLRVAAGRPPLAVPDRH